MYVPVDLNCLEYIGMFTEVRGAVSVVVYGRDRMIAQYLRDVYSPVALNPKETPHYESRIVCDKPAIPHHGYG